MATSKSPIAPDRVTDIDGPEANPLIEDHDLLGEDIGKPPHRPKDEVRDCETLDYEPPHNDDGGLR